jgi:hypothetical protein
LRLTEDHLVFTATGLRPASELSVGDIIFADLAQTHRCQVIDVSKETEDQTYFGLNCIESIVLANGIKTSSYGKYHTIPAFWMKHASKVVGIERASSIGDTIANALSIKNEPHLKSSDTIMTIFSNAKQVVALGVNDRC